MPSIGHSQFIPTREQQTAIEHVRGPMLVVAGAGTGKTTVLARRIAQLIQSGVARPDEILAVTYTRNAAAELMSRVAGLLYPPANQQHSLYPELDRQQAARKLMRAGLQAHTFHSYCYRLLKDAGTTFQLLDDKDLFVLLRRRIGELKLQHYIKAATPGKFLNDLLRFFSSCHDELRTPADYESYVGMLERYELPLPRMAKSKDAAEMPEDEVLGRCREVAYAFRFAETMLQEEGLGTFGHIITRAVDVLSRRKSVLERAQKHARYILIDEFQDSNIAQIKLAKLLAGDEANVFAVGDPDQAIYQFRGATSGAFDEFLRSFGAESVFRVTMSANRRSTPQILGCAYQAIKVNPAIVSLDRDWVRQPLTCARLEREPHLAVARPVQAIAPNDNEQEAGYVVDTIETMRRQNPDFSYKDVAVLYRSHYHREFLVKEFTRRGVPIKVKGADLFRTPELRDALAVLRIMDASHPVSLFRVAALPQVGIDPVRFRAELVLADSFSAEAALENIPGGVELLKTIREAQQLLSAANHDLLVAVETAQRLFQLPDTMPLRRLHDFAKRWCEKPAQIVGDGSLHQFLDYLTYFLEAGGTLVEETDEDDPVAALAPNDLGNAPIQDAVQLMTVHAAKGLEFPFVFVVRILSGSFPAGYKESLVEFPAQLRTRSDADSSDPKTQHEQEERRLFYVAMTRAMNELHVCGKVGKQNRQPAPPSKYVRELVTVSGASLKNMLHFQILPPAQIDQIHATAEAPINVSQWTQIPARTNGRMLELSASAIQTYENCPLAYKLRYDWKLPEDASAALQFGNAMHLALKAYFDGVRAGRAPDTETIVACFLDEFSKAKIDESLQRELYEKNGRQQLTAFLQSHLAQPEGKVLETERRFNIEVEGARVKGRLDRLDLLPGGEVAILDYKTGKPKTQEDANDSVQLAIYALAAESLGHKPASLVFINLQNGTAVGSARSESDLREAKLKITEIAGKIEAGEFDPKPGSRCYWCSYNSICPEQEEPLPRVATGCAVTVH